MESLTSYIPGTERFYVKKGPDIERETNIRIRQMEALELSEDTFARLEPKVTVHEQKLAKRAVRDDAIAQMILLPWVPVLVLSLFAGLLLSKIWPNLRNPSIGSTSNIFLYFVTLLVGFALMGLPIWLQSKSRAADSSSDEWKTVRRETTSTRLMFSWIAIVASLYLFVLYYYITAARISPPSVYMFVLLEGFAGVVTYCAVASAAILLVFIVTTALERRKRALYPDSLLVHSFLEVASLLRWGPNLWTDLEFKRRLMLELETIASNLQNDLPRRLRTQDAFTEIWLRERYYQMAAAIRSLKQWILTPMWDTHDRLCERLTENFVQAADGNWDGLERIDPPKLSQRQIYVRIGAIVRGIILSGLPIVGLILLQRSQFKLDGALAEYTKLITVVWAVVSLLSTFDPTFSAKLAAVKDIASSLNPISRGK